MLNLYPRGFGIPFYFFKIGSLFFTLLIHSQYFHLIYDLILLCKFSIISLKEASFDIFSSTFLTE